MDTPRPSPRTNRTRRVPLAGSSDTLRRLIGVLASSIVDLSARARSPAAGAGAPVRSPAEKGGANGSPGPDEPASAESSPACERSSAPGMARNTNRRLARALDERNLDCVCEWVAARLRDAMAPEEWCAPRPREGRGVST